MKQKKGGKRVRFQGFKGRKGGEKWEYTPALRVLRVTMGGPQMKRGMAVNKVIAFRRFTCL